MTAPTGGASAAPAGPAASAHPAGIAKRPLVRGKPTTHRELPRPARRVAAVMSAGSGSAPATPAPIIAPPGQQAADPGATAAISAELGHGRADTGGERETVAAPVAPPPAVVVVASPPAPPAPPNPGTLDATPAVLSLEVKGSLSPSIVRRSVERTLSSMRTCYRIAARAGGSTPALDLRLTFEVDENSRATQVATSGASFGTLASCATGVTSGIRTQQAPDTGTAQVAVVIRFRPS
jgi:hypothetical protein